jgi:hypothetical protein
MIVVRAGARVAAASFFHNGAPAPTTIHRIILSKIQKYIHFDQLRLQQVLRSQLQKTNNVALAPQQSLTLYTSDSESFFSYNMKV